MIKVTRLGLRGFNACWLNNEIDQYFGERKWISLLTLLNAPQRGRKSISDGDKAWLLSKYLPLEQRITICKWFDSHLECLNSENRAYQEARANHVIFDMLAFCPWAATYSKKREAVIELAKELLK